MAHALILGMTESGKTTLARRLAAEYKRQGFGVLVLDPLRDPRWPADFITDDPGEFLDVFWRSRSCFVFMDEGGESVGRYDTAMQKTATRGRHWGHSCHFIAQRATQLAPLVRDQCVHLFLFCSSSKDGEVLANEWNKPELATCAQFQQGEYVHAVKFGRTTRHQMNRSASNGSDNRSSGNRSDSGRNFPQSEEEVGERIATGIDGNSNTGSEGGDSEAASE